MTAPGLSIHMWNLSLWHVGSNFLTRDLISWQGIKPRSPALGAQSLSYWTTREVPISVTFSVELMSLRGKKCCPHNIQSSDSLRTLCPILTFLLLTAFLSARCLCQFGARMNMLLTCSFSIRGAVGPIQNCVLRSEGCSELLDQGGQLQSHGVQKERGWGLRAQHRKHRAVCGEARPKPLAG